MAQTVSGSRSDTEAIMTLAKRVHNVKSTAEDDVTLTVAEFINGLYIQTGTPGTTAKTTPTAAQIVAAIPEAAVGTMFEFVVDNGGDATLTVTAGDGVTGSGTLTVAAAKNRLFRGYITNVDTPAVRLVACAALA
jgi:hypothetical protein